MTEKLMTPEEIVKAIETHTDESLNEPLGPSDATKKWNAKAVAQLCWMHHLAELDRAEQIKLDATEREYQNMLFIWGMKNEGH